MNRLDRTALAIATLGPLGRVPFAPGTAGSAGAAVAAAWVFLPLGLGARLALLAAVLWLGAWAATRAERVLGKIDPGCVVVDELLGQWVAYLPLAGADPATILAGFALFRLLDIAKPWPIRRAEHWLPAGWGVMLDDLLAGLGAAAVLWLAGQGGLL